MSIITFTSTSGSARGSIAELIPSVGNIRRSISVVQRASVASGSSPAILWAVQWRTTGSTDQALRDYNAVGGYRWDSSTGGGSVVTAASTGISGWPTANVLRVPAGSGEAWCKLVKYPLAQLPIGNTRYYRWYFASTLDGNSSDDQAHPIETGDWTINLDEEYGIGQYFRSNLGQPPTEIVPERWNLSFMLDDGVHYRENTGPAFGDPVIEIPQHVVFRLELAITRTASSSYQAQVRRYNSSSLVAEADENDFYFPSIGNIAGRTFTLTSESTLRSWSAGSNQSGWMPSGSNPQSYQAAFAISDENWCGVYNAATEANWDA